MEKPIASFAPRPNGATIFFAKLVTVFILLNYHRNKKMNFWVNHLVTDLAQKHQYQEVITNVIVNTCYWGTDNYNGLSGRRPEAGFRFVKDNLMRMIATFFCNSTIGFYSHVQELMLFIISFHDYEETEEQQLTMPTHDVSQMSGLFQQWVLLFHKSDRPVVPTLLEGRDKARAYLTSIFDDLENRISTLDDNLDYRDVASPTECKTLFGSLFYGQLLSTVRELVHPENFDRTQVQKRVAEHQSRIPFSLYSTLACTHPSENGGKPLDHNSEIMKALREKYRQIPLEAAQLKTDSNCMLILAGLDTETFIGIIDDQEERNFSVPEAKTEILAEFTRRCQHLDLLQDHKFDLSTLPDNIVQFIGNVVLQEKETRTMTGAEVLMETPVFAEDYRRHQMFTQEPKGPYVRKFPIWLGLLIVILIAFMFV